MASRIPIPSLIKLCAEDPGSASGVGRLFSESGLRDNRMPKTLVKSKQQQKTLGSGMTEWPRQSRKDKNILT